MEQYLTISEFAQKAGVSKQAIYKQVNSNESQLAPYVKMQGKKKMIAETALVKCYGIVNQVEQPNQPISTQEVNQIQPKTAQAEADPEQQTAPGVEKMTTHSTQVEQLNQPNSTQVSTDYIEFLKTQIETLQAEKKELHSTIREKDQIIKQQSDQLSELAGEVAGIAHKALVTTSQQQYLTAAATAEKAQDPEYQATPKPERDNSYQATPDPEQPTKKSIFQRIFKR